MGGGPGRAPRQRRPHAGCARCLPLSALPVSLVAHSPDLCDTSTTDVRFAVAGPAHAPAHAYAAVPAPAAAQPAPAPAPIPHHPVAGPAYPNPILAAHYAAQAQAQDQAPVAAAAGAAAPDTPRSAAAQAALKRARDARSPSPPARAAPPPPAVAAAAAAAPPPPPPPQPAPAPAPAPASPPAPAAPAPGPAPAPAPAPADADDPPLSRCPKCSLLFSSLPCPSPAAEEAHLRQCLDAGGATVSECPVCGAGLEGLGEDEAARHVDECCEGATRGVGRAAREHVGASWGSRCLSLSLSLRAGYCSGGARGGQGAHGGGMGPQCLCATRRRRPRMTRRSRHSRCGSFPSRVTFPLVAHEFPSPPASASCASTSFPRPNASRASRATGAVLLLLSSPTHSLTDPRPSNRPSVFHETCIAEFWKAPGKFCPTHRELDDVTEVDMRVS